MVDNTFSRALLGFLLLTSALASMSYVALWAIDSYGGGAWWGSLLIVLLALAAEIGIYGTTLHEPIYGWIREPKRQAELAAISGRYVSAAEAAVAIHERRYHEGSGNAPKG